MFLKHNTICFINYVDYHENIGVLEDYGINLKLGDMRLIHGYYTFPLDFEQLTMAKLIFSVNNSG